jgi:hypothetical protein
MKVMIFECSKRATFTRLNRIFADDPDVKVVRARREVEAGPGGLNGDHRRDRILVYAVDHRASQPQQSGR